MENEQFTTLVNTLLGNNLAASPSEARRMAEEMIGTSKKVQDSFKKENHTYMVSNYKQKEDAQVKEQGISAATIIKTEENFSQPARSDEHLQQNIQELRERAINPQPVHVQVDFQTPDFDSRHEIAQESTLPKQTSQQEPTNTSKLAEDFHVTIPGVDTNKTFEDLGISNENNMPQAKEDLSREKDDFLTVRLEKTMDEKANENAMQASQASSVQNDVPKEELSSGSEHLTTGFPAQTAEAKEQIATKEQILPAHEEPKPIAKPTSSHPEQPKVNTPERKKDLWTPEERQLKEDCDLTKVFNFSGK